MSVSESESEYEDSCSGNNNDNKSEKFLKRSWIYKLNKKQLQDKLKQLQLNFSETQSVDELRRILSVYCKRTTNGKSTKMTSYSLNPFDGDNWKCFEQQLECIFLLNVVEEDKKVPLLLTRITPKVLDVLNCLCTPDDPIKLTYKELCTKLRDKYTQKQPTALERVTFRNRNQLSTETIEQYVLELRKLGGRCEFKDLDDQIREKLIDGVHSKLIKFELLKCESNKTLEEIITLAKTVEFALLQTTNGKERNEVSEVFFYQQGQRKERQTKSFQKFGKGNYTTSNTKKDQRCFCCGATNHTKSQCSLLKKYCSECGRQGHIFKMCSRNKKINTAYNLVKEDQISYEIKGKDSDEESTDQLYNDMKIYAVNVCGVEKAVVSVPVASDRRWPGGPPPRRALQSAGRAAAPGHAPRHPGTGSGAAPGDTTRRRHPAGRVSSSDSGIIHSNFSTHYKLCGSIFTYSKHTST